VCLSEAKPVGGLICLLELQDICENPFLTCPTPFFSRQSGEMPSNSSYFLCEIGRKIIENVYKKESKNIELLSQNQALVQLQK